jgi:hypothetical protein
MARLVATGTGPKTGDFTGHCKEIRARFARHFLLIRVSLFAPPFAQRQSLDQEPFFSTKYKIIADSRSWRDVSDSI